MGSKYLYRYTQKATDDLNSILQYITEDLANPSAPAAFWEKLQKAIEEARCFPERNVPVISQLPIP